MSEMKPIRPPVKMAVEKMQLLPLGWQGENRARPILIDVRAWEKAWPGCSVELLLCRPVEADTYPARAQVENGELVFWPESGDTQLPGRGKQKSELFRRCRVQKLHRCKRHGCDGNVQHRLERMH